MKKKEKAEEILEVNTAEIPDAVGAVREITTEFPTLKDEMPVVEKKPKKKGGFFHREKKEKDDEEVLLSFLIDEEIAETQEVNTTIDDTREVFSELPTQPIPSLSDTQVMDGEEESLPEKGTQMLLEGFEEEERPQEEMGREERLRRVRREQIEDFSQRREQHMREGEQEQEEIPEERGEVVYPETPLENEETVDPTQEREAPSSAIGRFAAALHRSNATVFCSVVLEIILFLLTLFSAFSPVLAMGPISYLCIQIALFVSLCALNISLLRDGVVRLFSGKPTVASGVFVSAFVTLVHTVLQFLNTTDLRSGATPLLTAVSGLSILLLALSKHLEWDRRLKNAAFVLSERNQKTVYKRIEDDTLAEEIGRPALAIGVPRVAYYRDTMLVDNYEHLADDSALTEKQMKWYLPVVLGISLLVSLLFFALNGISSWMVTLTLFCVLVAVASPSLFLFTLQVSFASAAKTAKSEGSALVGYHAIEQFGKVHAIALDAMDIFPEQCVLLHGIKTFSGTRIDDAILDAASVSVRAGGPLSFVFSRMIQNKVDMLREVDTLVYEQDMGLSGWVSGRRVLIGNRKLLDNHGIDIPSKDYEERYAINGRQLVYLSIAGELSAMFVVSYVADDHVKQMLTTLTKQRITLLVRTCDQNITEQLISTVYDLNGFYVELLGAPAGRSFEGLVDGVSESQESSIVSNGNRNGLILALALCRRLTKNVNLFTVLQTVLSFALMFLAAYTMFFAGGGLSPLYLVETLLVATLAFTGISLFAGKR